MTAFFRQISLQAQKLSIFLRGVFHFGPASASRGVKVIQRALDAYEERFGRLPSEHEQRRMVAKLAWFEQEYQRMPTHREMEQIIQQLQIVSDESAL